MNPNKQLIFAIGAYALVILLYATWALFISAFANAFPFSYLVAIGYFIYILLGHLSVTAYWRLNHKPKQDKNKIPFLCASVTNCFGIFFSGPKIRDVGDGVSKFQSKFYWIVYPIKITILLLYIVLYAFYLDNAFRIISYAIFLILMISVTFHRFRVVHGVWIFMFASLPFILLWLIVIGMYYFLFSCCIMTCNKGMRRLYKNSNHDITLGGLLKLPFQEFIKDAGLFDNPEKICSEEDSDMSVEGSLENHDRISKDVPQTLKAKSIKIDTKQIQNNNDIEQDDNLVFGFVCKEILQPGETIIEIEGCSQNAFHTKCAKELEDKLHSCSIGNKRLNEQANNPRTIFQLIVENKV